MELDCGIPRARIVGWLDDELMLPIENRHWIFRADSGSCRISLEPLADQTLGGLSLERTCLRADGDIDAIEAFRHLFILRFASAGG